MYHSWSYESRGINTVRQAEPQCLVRLHYNWEVARYPRRHHLRQANPLPFIPWSWRITPKDWGLFSRFTPLDLPCSAQTGSRHIGCGSSPRTDGLGGQRLHITHLPPLGNKRQCLAQAIAITPWPWPDQGTGPAKVPLTPASSYNKFKNKVFFFV